MNFIQRIMRAIEEPFRTQPGITSTIVPKRPDTQSWLVYEEPKKGDTWLCATFALEAHAKAFVQVMQTSNWGGKAAWHIRPSAKPIAHHGVVLDKATPLTVVPSRAWWQVGDYDVFVDAPRATKVSVRLHRR